MSLTVTKNIGALPADGGGCAELVRRIAAHDEDAVEDFYGQWQQGVRWYFCRHLGPHDLDDRVHDVLVDAVVAIQRGQLREPDRLVGFVRGIARHRICEAIKERVAERQRDTSGYHDEKYAEGHLDTLAAPGPSACSDLLQQEQVAVMRAAITERSDRDRQVLERFYLLGQSQEEICAAMELTDTQFRLQKSRAKARLMQAVQRKSARLQLATSRRHILNARPGGANQLFRGG